MSKNMEEHFKDYIGLNGIDGMIDHDKSMIGLNGLEDNLKAEFFDDAFVDYDDIDDYDLTDAEVDYYYGKYMEKQKIKAKEEAEREKKLKDAKLDRKSVV